ncbi:heme-dependent oxidative N-demethylase subunit alpha family protein [Roseimicrobium sp. ORNL1]|uniref:heme-dependent oxidative N-demethylase subunit alpha family protein n=1 Tax=Roseimicrobium sp. ORNL1 TaxID=2711231 RepID=UPI0013E15E0D|nr:heme-dependent oxidative N-demethylase subunit alpha family protein [Roseimicrobium sp. ORNL1]QIF03659.1 DUF3445 domain-containing protein [Roseimicrobium sp. ORNL1]
MPDWTRSFPDADHRWVMALRPVDDARDFFAAQDATGAMLGERARWLAEEEQKYAALLPEAEAAAVETWEMARAWGHVCDDDDGDGHVPSPMQAMLRLGHAWEPDLVWMHPDETGTHRLAGGVVCFPSSWALREKLGRMMAEVHGPVPALNGELGRQIDTFLQRMAPGAVWRRENWSLSRDGELNHHPSHQRLKLDAGITVHDVWLRLEHQLLMKLPNSGSVLFGIRIEVVPLGELMRDEEAAARLARLVATMSEEAAAYKGLATARGALLGMLRGES